jgi:hypothetical protein
MRLSPLLASLVLGCASGSEPAGTTSSPISYRALRVANGWSCADDEVMIGIHAAQRKSICAQLPLGWTVGARYVDNGYQIRYAGTSMHGCNPYFYIQRIYSTSSYECVAIKDRDGHYLIGYDEHIDSGSNPTQSSLYTSLPGPVMHACWFGYAMTGWHKDRNDLACRD